MGDVARLQDFQFVAKHKTPDDIVEELALSMVKPHSSVGDLLLEMSEVLDNINPATLKRAIQIMDNNCLANLNLNAYQAYTLALSIASEQHKALQNLSVLLQKIGHVIKKDRAKTLLKMILHLWVNPVASENLSEAQQKRLPITMNGYNPEDFTAKSYADRAWGRGMYLLVSVGDCRSLGDIDDVMRLEIGHKTMPKRNVDQYLEKLSDPEEKSNPVVLLVFPVPNDDSVIASSLPDEQLLKEIMEKYPTMAVFIPAGEARLDFRTDIKLLEPLLDVTVEDEQYMNYREVMENIKKI